jgi:hypothetical protein
MNAYAPPPKPRPKPGSYVRCPMQLAVLVLFPPSLIYYAAKGWYLRRAGRL